MFIEKKNMVAIEAMKYELLCHNWNEVYVEDINHSYTAFLEIFLRIYDKHCPLKQCKQKCKKVPTPWMCRDLVKACRKKNHLYHDFIQNPTKEKEKQYKDYKNRLTTIIRKQKKDYYDQLLQKHKNYIKSTWMVINELIKNKKERDVPTGAENKNYIADAFNDFFINVGPNLAEQLPKADDIKFDTISNSNTMS